MFEKINNNNESQRLSKDWWTNNPMAYNWKEPIKHSVGTLEYFREVDNRFFNSSPFYKGNRPFENLIPFESLRDKKVLEIGCGMGSHAQLFCELGCDYTAIDLTSTAVELTTKRMELQDLKCNIIQMDAESMSFNDNEFDFVWSWGVIHHSANTNKILSEVNRVLKPSGEFRSMVYYKASLSGLIASIRGVLSGKIFKNMSLNEIMSFYTDGHLARHYTISEFNELLNKYGFSVREIKILGQRSEIVLLPNIGVLGDIKSYLINNLPDSASKLILSRFGGFLFAVCTK